MLSNHTDHDFDLRGRASHPVKVLCVKKKKKISQHHTPPHPIGPLFICSADPVLIGQHLGYHFTPLSPHPSSLPRSCHQSHTSFIPPACASVTRQHDVGSPTDVVGGLFSMRWRGSQACCCSFAVYLSVPVGVIYGPIRP